MSHLRDLILTVCLTFSLASAQFISTPQSFQAEVLDQLVPLPEERSVNVLNVQLPQNKLEREPVVHVKPIYVPVPVKDVQTSQLSYQAYQPNSVSYVPQQAIAQPSLVSYVPEQAQSQHSLVGYVPQQAVSQPSLVSYVPQQAVSQPSFVSYVPQQTVASYQQQSQGQSQNQNQNQNPDANLSPSLLQQVAALSSKYPWLFAPNEFPQVEYPSYITAPQIPVFYKNPTPQLPQLPQIAQQNTNATQSILQFLPQFLNSIPFYNPQISQRDALREGYNFADNLEQIAETNPNKNVAEITIEPDMKEPNIVISGDMNLAADDAIQYNRKGITTKVNEADGLLQTLLQKLSSRRRIQERIGAVYLRDSLLNRK